MDKNNVIKDDRGVKYYLYCMNYFDLKKLEENLSNEYKRNFKNVLRNSKDDDCLLEANKIYKELQQVRIYINKMNGYRKIKEYEESYYDRDINILVFHDKKHIKKWLDKNKIKVGYKSFNICNDYDCSGNLTSINIEKKGNKLIITKDYDL